MFEALEKLRNFVIDILLPRFCVGCGREGEYICKDCDVFLSEVDPRVIGHQVSEWDTWCPITNTMSVWEYEGIIEKAIYKIKFDGMYHIIDELTEKALEKIELNLPDDAVITYVPMWPKKERGRGFNQAELIAKKLGEMVGRPVAKLLEKTKDNRSQVGLGPQERIANVKGVFGLAAPGADRLVGTWCRQNVLLVDDVYTTGATMNECIKILKKAGVKNIWGFTLSRKMNIQNY